MASVVSWRGEKRQPERNWNDAYWHISNHPVEGVTWYEAVAFCKWLTEQVGYEVRLPNEAEWEKAARGPDGRVYPWGDDISGYAKIDETAGEVGSYYLERTSAVGIYPQFESPYGVLDMSGNVMEWCTTKSDWKYIDGLEGMDNDLAGTESRMLRGGSWVDGVWLARGAHRSEFLPDFRNNSVGFRVCASAPT